MAQTIHRQSANIGDNNANCNNTIGSYNTTTIYKSDKDAEIMRWLSPLEPDNRHHDVRTKRFEGVGNWLLETSEFREWRGGEGAADKAVLFCSGNPGVGKTNLSSLVIDTLCDHVREEGIVVAWLYCDYNAQQDQTVINMMGAILKRLLGSEIPEDIRKAFREGRRPLLADLMRMLRIAVASLPQIFICIDALDECLPGDLPELLESLREVVREFPRTRIFLTGRPYVKGAIERYFTTAVAIPISPDPNDIRNYLERRLNRDDEPEAMSDGLRAEIMQAILDKVSDIFLLVSLKIEAILGEVTISLRREKLKEMARSNGLSDAYTGTLNRLKSQKGNRARLGLKALRWVLYSERPLHAEELCHALGVKIGSTDSDLENVPAIQTVLASSLGLLTVEASSSIVRLVHFTLKEHLANDPTLSTSSHSEIAEVCLTYLNFGSVRDLSPTLYWAPPAMPLLEYASLYWGEHAKRGITRNSRILALRLLDGFDKHLSTQLLLLHYMRDWDGGPTFNEKYGPTRFTGLHGVAFLGIVELVVPMLEMNKWDINAFDCTGSTALIWAALRGEEEIVRMILERNDVKADQGHISWGQTPLAWAAERGHEGVVKMLLERKDVNPNQENTWWGQTPLLHAAKRGHEGVVKILLERKDVNPDPVDPKYGQTPLYEAARMGYEGIVKIISEQKDANPGRINPSDRRTPLWIAAFGGHEGVVKILLEQKDVNPDQADTGGQTPLSWAVKKGHEGIAKMLLERRDVDPDQAVTEDGQTPLVWAVMKGHQDVVKILLERKDVNLNQALTALCQAMRTKPHYRQLPPNDMMEL